MPDVAVIVIVESPAGVFGEVGPVEPDDEPPHPERAWHTANARTTAPIERRITLLRLRPAKPGQIRSASKPSDATAASARSLPPGLCPSPFTTTVSVPFTSVAIVITAVTAAPFGVTLAGAKVQVVYAGRPLHVSDTDVENAPVGVTVIVTLVEDPAEIAALPGEAESEKSGASETITCIAAEIDVASELSPEYSAVMLCVPTASVLVVYVAMPADKATLPSVVAPSRNVTEPVGCEVPEIRDTVAVNVTAVPVTTLLAEAVSTTWVAASALTVRLAVALVSPGLLAVNI